MPQVLHRAQKHASAAACPGDVAELLAHEDAMRVPVAVRRLVDAGVEPLVVAKTLAIGDRDGELIYRHSTQAGAFALAEHEAIAVNWISLAIRDADPGRRRATGR